VSPIAARMTRRRVVGENEQRDCLQRNLRARREALGLTVTAAAAGAGMHRRHWQKIEACEVNVTLATLSKLSLGLGVDVVALMREPTLGTRIEAGIGTTEEALRERLAVQVRALRTKQALTLKVASERAGIFWRHWQKIEAGEVDVTLQTLIRVASALRKPPAELLSAA
jgi:transcriptional regulator with XRE-family HTH domain